MQVGYGYTLQVYRTASVRTICVLGRTMKIQQFASSLGDLLGSVLGHPPGEFRHLRGPAGALCLGKRQPQTYPIHFARFRARVSLDAT
jgi:hypothetical protein